MTGALDGVGVVEWCTGTSGAFCGKLLADLGADVVKIEPPGGDPARGHGPFPPGRESGETSGRFLYTNTGKRSAVLDASAADDAAELCRMAVSADVVIDDDLEGVLRGLVGEPPAHVVWCSITPFGLTGPYRDHRAYHLNTFHAGGEGHLLPTGDGYEQFPDRPPIQIGSDVADFDTGANAAVAVIAAVLGQRRFGRGQQIDVSAHESALALNRTRLVRFTHDGRVLHRTKSPYSSAGGMFSCRDGYVQILGPRDESWHRFAELPDAERIGDERFATVGGRSAAAAELNGLVADWCARQDKAAVVDALAPLGFAIGAYATARDVLSSPQLESREFFQTVAHADLGAVTLPGPPYRLSATPVVLGPAPRLGSAAATPDRTDADYGHLRHPGRARTGEDRQSAPLAGVRVLDFTWAIAGPYCTLLLTFLGAEVIKVESSSRLDVTRVGMGGIRYGGINQAPDFNTLNLNKRSLGVDLSQPAGLELVKRLVPVCDIVVDNFRPGVMHRFGLGAERLLADYPSLIVASSSGAGSTGPEALHAGLASIFAATGGASDQTGYPDGPPTLIGESPDYRSGNLLAVAILAALVHRDRTGSGQYVDLSSREVAACLAPDALLAEALGAPWAPRLGNRHRRMAPHNVYPALGPDEWVSIAVGTDDEWRSLSSILGRDDWPTRYPDAASRHADEDAIDATIAAWTSTRPARAAVAELQASNIAAAVSATNAELVDDPHLAARGAFVTVEHPEIGSQRVLSAPWRLAETGVGWRPGPRLGQDNDYVLADILGVTPDERAVYTDALETA